MATCKVVKDPDNKWFTYIDWQPWITNITTEMGGTLTITNSTWYLDTGLVDESSPTAPLSDNKTVLQASGGTDGETYSAMNRITYNHSSLSPQDLTEDRTITIKIQEK